MASRHLLTKSDFYFPVGVCIEAMFFGFYTAVFMAALWIWGKRRSRARSSTAFSGLVYLVFITLMWIVASLHFGMSMQRFLRVYILELQVDSKPIAIRLMDSGRWDTLAHMILTTLMIWLGDVLVLYRTYVVWDRNIWVIALPILLHITYLIINSIAIYALSHPYIIPRRVAVLWYQPVFPLVFAQNLITTGLLFYKVWAQHRASTANGVAVERGALSLGRIARMLIETAMLYTLELLVVIILGITQHPAKGIVSVALVPTLGIVFVLLSVRVHFGGTPDLNGTRNTSTLGNLPNLFRDSVSDESMELGQPAPLAIATSRLGHELKPSDKIMQRSEFEDQAQGSLSFPTASFSMRTTSREC